MAHHLILDQKVPVEIVVVPVIRVLVVGINRVMLLQ
jgi:hypothetical protein